MNIYRSYSSLPPVVLTLLLTNAGVFLLEFSGADRLIDSFALCTVALLASSFAGISLKLSSDR